MWVMYLGFFFFSLEWSGPALLGRWVQYIWLSSLWYPSPLTLPMNHIKYKPRDTKLLWTSFIVGAIRSLKVKISQASQYNDTDERRHIYILLFYRSANHTQNAFSASPRNKSTICDYDSNWNEKSLPTMDWHFNVWSI